MEENKNILIGHYSEARDFLDSFLSNPEYLNLVSEAADILVECVRGGNKIMSGGNGGSMCDAMHFAEELSGRWRLNRRGLPAVSISDPSHITCVANDFGYDKIFSRYLEALGNPGDVFLGISTSGNSKNVIEAIKHASENGIKCVILTGNSGGEISNMRFPGVIVRTPESKFADRIQEMHIKIIHSLIDIIEKRTLPVAD